MSKLELNYGEREKISNEDRKEISQLRGRVAQLEDLVANVITIRTIWIKNIRICLMKIGRILS